ncbi:hypothetical protein HYFRA_00002266 [Hymenoscyphus fraxineus]|uniref:Uncharacterized protein n=1 Tax=Hymenoscyphus fraxineus TaxID=746836 RepID=A0A9N9L5I5_9HELO|nr:hypothetical protein HYFRA_00002266 [Hymenoscyphus fraxineus]
MTSQSRGGLEIKLQATPEDPINCSKAKPGVRVEASQFRVECCKLRLESCKLNLEADILKYQNAVAGFEKEHSVTTRFEDSTLPDFLPLVRERSRFYSSRCELSSRIRAGEKDCRKLQEALDNAIEELRLETESEQAAGIAGRISQLGEINRILSKSASIEQLTRANKILEERLEERDGVIATQEEIIKVDAELFFQRSCIVQEQNARLRDLELLSKYHPHSEANLLAEKNNKIVQLERELANLHFENGTLKSGIKQLETQVKDLSKKCKTYKERVRLANNSRDNARDRLNEVKAERDAAEANVSRILDLDQLVASCKAQSQQLTELASILSKEKGAADEIPRKASTNDDLPIQHENPIQPSSASPFKPENLATHVPQEILVKSTPSEPLGTSTKPSRLSDFSRKFGRVIIALLSHNNNTMRSPIREENNINSFLILDYMHTAVEGVFVWAALLSSGAVVLWPLLLVAHHIVYGFEQL